MESHDFFIDPEPYRNAAQTALVPAVLGSRLQCNFPSSRCVKENKSVSQDTLSIDEDFFLL
jgi:hypothetical protein